MIVRGERQDCGPATMKAEWLMRPTLCSLALVMASACAGTPVQAPVGIPEAPVRVGSILHGEEPLTKVLPALPAEAAARGVLGPVLLEIRITETGMSPFLTSFEDIPFSMIWQRPPLSSGGTALWSLTGAQFRLSKSSRCRLLPPMISSSGNGRRAPHNTALHLRVSAKVGGTMRTMKTNGSRD
jgi:hypothetical protein